jgi:ABC-2 type transport system permease protein
MGGLLVLGTFFAPMIVDVVGGTAAQTALKEVLSSPAMVALCGLAYGDEYTYGAMYAQFMLVWVILGFAVMNILFVVRHTRKDEEEGRTEMVGALPVGRNANLLAVLVVACAVNVLLAVLTGITIALCGVETLDWEGSLVFGCALGANGLFFAGIAVLFAQLFSTSKAATGASLAVLGAAYLLRAIGDVSSETAARFSPLGLVERSEIYVSNYLWPEIVLVMVGLVICLVAFILSTYRENGRGMLPSRAGRARASVFLRGGLGLSWRLSRGTMFAWAVLVFIFAAAYGSIFGDIDAFVANNSMYQVILGIGEGKANVMDPVIATMTLIMSITATIPVVIGALRLKVEEDRNRMEQLLVGSVSRVRLIIGEAVICALLAVVLQLLSALGMWSAAALVMDEPRGFVLYLGAALSFLPAMLVFVGLGIFIVGVVPRLSALIWVYLIYAFFVGFLGDVFALPEWAEKLSVFGLLSRYPVDAIEPVRVVALCVLALALVAAGAAAYRRRDLA